MAEDPEQDGAEVERFGDELEVDRGIVHQETESGNLALGFRASARGVLRHGRSGGFGGDDILNLFETGKHDVDARRLADRVQQL